MSTKAERLSRVMNMKANGPTLVPITRTTSFLDYNQLSASDKTKYSRNCDDYIRTQTIRCQSAADYFKFMAALREKRRLLALKSDYAGATQVDELIRQLSDFFIENHLYTSKAQLVDVVSYQYHSQRNRLMSLIQKWDDKINNAQSQYEKELRELENQCQAVIDKHDANIPSKLPVKYNKLSSDLLNLREQERHLIGSRRFAEAEQYHKEFEKRKEQELNNKKLEYFESSEKRRKEKEIANQKRISALKDLWERRISELEYNKNREVLPLERAIEALQRKYTIAKSEYIGEDDLIPEEVVFQSKELDASDLLAQGTFRDRDLVSYETSITPRSVTARSPGRTLTGNERPIDRGVVGTTDKKRTTALRKQGTVLESSRWPKTNK